MKSLGTKIGADTYEEFVDSCKNKGTNPSEKMRDLVEDYLEKQKKPSCWVDEDKTEKQGDES